MTTTTKLTNRTHAQFIRDNPIIRHAGGYTFRDAHGGFESIKAARAARAAMGKTAFGRAIVSNE